MNVDKKGNVYWLIAIEGLDCSGKETFAKQLKKFMEANINKTNPDRNSNEDKKNIKVHLVSFPDYTIESGKELKELLKLDPKKRDQDKLTALFAKNRKDVLDNLDVAKYNIVIFDRFIMSNIIYGMLPVMLQNGMTRSYASDTQFYNLLKAGIKEMDDLDIWSMDRTVIFSRFGSKAVARKHDQLLEAKQDKDANENPSTQACLSSIIDMYVNEKTIEEICLQHNDVDAYYDSSRIFQAGDYDRTNIKIGFTFNRTRCLEFMADIFYYIKLYLECFD